MPAPPGSGVSLACMLLHVGQRAEQRRLLMKSGRLRSVLEHDGQRSVGADIGRIASGIDAKAWVLRQQLVKIPVTRGNPGRKADRIIVSPDLEVEDPDEWP